VDLVHYLPDAKLDRSGKFQPQSEEPRNPLVELLVHVPHENEPFRQVAFAKSPLLNLDGVYDRVCPVKFVYQHPKFQPTTAIEFMQGKGGTLYARITADGKRKAHGEVSTGNRLEIAGGFSLLVDEYLPHAQRQISFKSVSDESIDKTPEPASEVELSVAGTTSSIWLQRNHLEFQRRPIETPEGPLLVHFGSALSPLGFSLRLIDCYGSPGNSRSAAGASTVALADEDLKGNLQRQVTVTQPLKYQGFTFYQSACRDAGHGKQASVFHVIRRPGRPLNMVGAWIMFLGVAITFVMRTYWSIDLARQWQMPSF
jgi:hypothetical protein